MTENDYITIVPDGTLVGGKPALHYHNEIIKWKDDIRMHMDRIQRDYPFITQVHVLSSETQGTEYKLGTPSGKPGPYAWCRVKYNCGFVSQWVNVKEYETVAECAQLCADNVMWILEHDPEMLRILFSNKPGKSSLVDVLQNINLEQFVGTAIQINGCNVAITR